MPSLFVTPLNGPSMHFEADSVSEVLELYNAFYNMPTAQKSDQTSEAFASELIIKWNEIPDHFKPDRLAKVGIADLTFDDLDPLGKDYRRYRKIVILVPDLSPVILKDRV